MSQGDVLILYSVTSERIAKRLSLSSHYKCD